MLQLITKKSSISFVFAITIAVLGGLTLTTKKAEAACAAQDTTRGTVTSSFTVAQAGTYSVWSRIQANGTNDSYILEIDGTTCGITVGNANNNATGWNWINYKDGNGSSKITVNLPAGTHSMTMIGKEDGVQLEQVLFLSDTGCTPTGVDGGVCVAPDTVKPQVSITSPTNGQTVVGSPVQIQANASDDRGVVSKVEFYMGTTLLGTDSNGAPWGWPLVTTPYPPGTYQLTAKAFDDAPGGGNWQISSAVSFTIPVPPDTTKPTISITAPLANSTVGNTVPVIFTANDNVAVTRVDIHYDTTLVKSITTGPFTKYDLDTKAIPDGNHTIKATAYDAAGQSAVATVAVKISNPVAPTYKLCDFNKDKTVGLIDLSTVISWYDKSVAKNTSGDCTSDSFVDLIDLSQVISTWDEE